MSIKNIRLEVMQLLEKKVDTFMNDYLIPVEQIWQPSDLLPDSEKGRFIALKEAIKKIRPHQNQALKELKDILVEKNLTKYL